MALVLPRQAGFRLDADLNRRGRLDSDFDVHPNSSTERRHASYRGAINGGGPRLVLETSRGTYRLRASLLPLSNVRLSKKSAFGQQ